MASLQIYLIWCVYGIAIAILIAVASTFICAYQTPRDRSNSVTLMCIFSITVLLATVLLLPVDVALVSSTTSSALGQRKSWATQDEVDKITFSLTVVYYSLYSLDALLCLIGIPFTYFWYEEYDEVAAETGQQTTGQRFWATLKYTLFFISIVIVLFLVGFFIPISQNLADDDSDFLRRLFTENRGEHALTFSLGILITLGFGLYIMYTSSGLAMLPVLLMKTAPSFASPSLITSTAMQLNSNRERQRQLEGRCGGNPTLLSPKDRRELDTLVREERTLTRRQRLVDGAQEQRSWLIRGFLKMDAILHPFKLLAGFMLLLVALFLWTSLCGTAIDKLMNSPCKQHCGYILERINIFNPVNWVLIQSARVFPVDYFIFTLIILFFFCSSVVSIAAIGIRFFWIQIFSIRKDHTSPQALLLATSMLMLITLAVNYTVAMVLAPQYATFGPQTFCDLPPLSLGGNSDCSRSTYLIKPCSEKAENIGANGICTPSVASIFLNRMTSNFPFFGAVFSWAQFIFLGIYLLVLVVSISRSPRFDERQWDEDAEEAEEERLLARSGRHATAT